MGLRTLCFCIAYRVGNPDLFDIRLESSLEISQQKMRLVDSYSTCSPQGIPTLIAFLMRVATPVLRASTNRPVVAGLAYCTLSTRVIVARINANVVYASLIVWTFIIMLAFPSLNWLQNKGERKGGQ